MLIVDVGTVVECDKECIGIAANELQVGISFHVNVKGMYQAAYSFPVTRVL